MGRTWAAAGLAVVIVSGVSGATTREVAEVSPRPLSINQSVLFEVTDGIFRTPYDELQMRPYNLLFVNVDRNPNLSPWPGQTGEQIHYLNALVGNNGATDVDGDADVLQGAYIRQRGEGIAWGFSGGLFSSENDSNDITNGVTFDETDSVSGFDFRGSVAKSLSDSFVGGVGVRLFSQTDEVIQESFAPLTGGSFTENSTDQTGGAVDVGVRKFMEGNRSWEASVHFGFGDGEVDNFSDTLDVNGAITDRFVVTDYDLTDTTYGVRGQFNTLAQNGRHEGQYRIGLTVTERELDNDALAFQETAGVVTPSLTLLNQDAVSWTTVYGAVEHVFFAGPTQGLRRPAGQLQHARGFDPDRRRRGAGRRDDRRQRDRPRPGRRHAPEPVERPPQFHRSRQRQLRDFRNVDGDQHQRRRR